MTPPTGLDALDVDAQLDAWTGSVLDPRGTTPTGIPELDGLLKRGGLQPSTFCILTGRCVTPDTKVLTADLRYVEAQDLRIGQEIFSFDESPVKTKFRRGTVTDTAVIWEDCVEVETSHGTVVCTLDHKFRMDGKVSGKQVRPERYWKRAVDLSPGDKIKSLGPAWDEDTSKEAGYLAGWYDGEGCLSDRLESTQVLGDTLDYVENLHTLKGYRTSRYNCRHDDHPVWQESCKLAIRGGLAEILRFLGSIRPRRLIQKSAKAWEGKDVGKKGIPCATVASVKPVGLKAVIALQTSTGTLVTNGLLSHNTGTRKTTVTTNLIRLLLKQGVAVGMVGLDESTSSYVAKLASAITGVNHEWIENQVYDNGGWNTPTLQRILEMYRLQAGNAFTLSKGTRPDKDALSLWLEYAEIQGNERPQVVFLDYLSIMDRDKWAGQEMTRIPRLMEEIQTWTHDEDVTTIILHQVGRNNGGNGDMPMSLDGMKFGGEEMADIVLSTYRPALDELGTKDFDEARAIKGDDFKREDWNWHVQRVEKYKTSTFLQLLKNRPGTRVDERGIELFSTGDSMQVLSERMGGYSNMKARVV